MLICDSSRPNRKTFFDIKKEEKKKKNAKQKIAKQIFRVLTHLG